MPALYRLPGLTMWISRLWDNWGTSVYQCLGWIWPATFMLWAIWLLTVNCLFHGVAIEDCNYLVLKLIKKVTLKTSECLVIHCIPNLSRPCVFNKSCPCTDTYIHCVVCSIFGQMMKLKMDQMTSVPHMDDSLQTLKKGKDNVELHFNFGISYAIKVQCETSSVSETLPLKCQHWNTL